MECTRRFRFCFSSGEEVGPIAVPGDEAEERAAAAVVVVVAVVGTSVRRLYRESKRRNVA